MMKTRLLFRGGTFQERAGRIEDWLKEHHEPTISNLRAFCGLIYSCDTNGWLASDEEEPLYDEIIKGWISLSGSILPTIQKIEELRLVADLVFDSDEVDVWLLQRWTVLVKSWEDCHLGYLFQPSDWKRYNRKTSGLENNVVFPYPVLGQYDHRNNYEMAKIWARYCRTREEISKFYFIMTKYDIKDATIFSGTNWRPWRLIIAINRWLELDPSNETLRIIKASLRDKNSGRRLGETMGRIEHELGLDWQIDL